MENTQLCTKQKTAHSSQDCCFQFVECQNDFNRHLHAESLIKQVKITTNICMECRNSTDYLYINTPRSIYQCSQRSSET